MHETLRNLMSPNTYNRYEQICFNDGGQDRTIADTDKGRKELSDLLSGIRNYVTTTKNDKILIRALLKVSTECLDNITNPDIPRYNEDNLAQYMTADFFSAYLNISKHDKGKNEYIVDSSQGYIELQELYKKAKKYGNKEDVIMLKALLDVASDYAPKSANKPNWWDRFKPKPKQNDEEKPAVPVPPEPKSEKTKPKVKTPTNQTKPQKTEPKQVKPKEKQPKKVQNNQPEQQNTNQNNTGINNSFNNNSGVIIIK